MTFLSFALSNLKRSRVRSVLTVLSVATACATLGVVLSLDRGYRNAVNDELVRKAGVHIYITREGCPMEAASIIAQGGISPLYVPASILGKLAGVKGLQAVMPFNIFALTTEDGTRTDIFFGVTRDLLRMRPDLELEKGGWFNRPDSIILGAEMARLEKREVGDKIYFEQLKREFTVSGILRRNFGQDDGAFFLPLGTAQSLIDRKDKLSAIAIKLEDMANLTRVKTELRGLLPADYYVISAKELGDGVMTFFGSTRAIMMVTVIVAFFVSILGVVNTKLMTIEERKKELAYLKCVGAGSGDIVRLVTLEGFIMSVAGSLLGIGVALAAGPWFEGFFRKFLVVYVPSSQIIRTDPAILAFSAVTVVIVGMLATLYPAIKAARVRPMEVMRND